MPIFELDEPAGAWFELDGGGRIHLRPMTFEALKAIRAQTVRKRVEYKRVEGRAERFEVEDVNADLQNELFWDYVILGWEKFIRPDGSEIPCTRETKIRLLMGYPKLLRYVNECLELLAADVIRQAQVLEKN